MQARNRHLGQAFIKYSPQYFFLIFPAAERSRIDFYQYSD